MPETINPDDKRAADVRAQLQRVLLALKENPTRAPRSYAALARRIGVDASTLWRHRKADPQVEEIAETIVRAGKASRLPRATPRSDDGKPLELQQPEPDGLATLPDEELEVRAIQLLRKARWAMQRFAAKGRHHKHLADLPRAVFDLDRSIAQASAVAKEVRTIAYEWLRRQRAATSKDAPEQRSLSFASRRNLE